MSEEEHISSRASSLARVGASTIVNATVTPPAESANEDPAPSSPASEAARTAGSPAEVDDEFPERPVTLGVRYYNYEAFVNHTTGDEGDYVIEALVSKSNLLDEIEAEKVRRDSSEVNRLKPIVSIDANFGSDQRLQRVRIRSEVVLSELSSLMRCSEAAEQVLVFCRPFGVFEHYYKDMKKILTDWETALESKIALGAHAGVNALATREATTLVEVEMTRQAPSVPSETALQHMRCYLQFVEENILPLRLQYLEPKPTRHQIRYEDIPLLFKPGELVHYRLAPEKGQTLHRSAVQQVWRITEIIPMDHPQHSEITETKLNLYYLDFDGDKIGPVWQICRLDYFEGEKEITELECYPLYFHPNHKSIFERQKTAGKQFKEAISQGVQHLYYSGWTFVTGVLAEPLLDDKGDRIKHPEYIESEVVIDFKETVRTFPEWQTRSEDSEISVNSEFNDAAWDIISSKQKVRIYADSREPNFRLLDDNMLAREDGVYIQTRNRYFTEDVFLQEEADLANYTWKEDDLSLMPKRLFGYVLRERRFARLDVACIQWNSEQNKVTLNNIEMDDEHRQIIRSAVSSHFKAQHQEKTLNISTFNNLDAIRGKGRGLTILLHGAPGVGKTATAEAVAIESKKPLFPITCGDLGTKPEVVDKTLRDIFRYAHLWECILLFDEADVFLTQRERSSLERNALVGVFLRVLEYYRGVLFLTTNRVGALDEAFRSRVHISLWYPHLTVERTIQVLRNCLQRLPQPPAKDGKPVYGLIKVLYKEIEDFVESEYRRYSKAAGKARGPWNGRQVRNAVQIAACLALYQKDTEDSNDDCPAILTAQHFQSVARTTTDFEKFLKKTRVGDDSYWAHQRNDRADDWDDADDYEADEYQYEAIDLTPSHRPMRPAGGRFLHSAPRKTGVDVTEPPTLPSGRRGSLESGSGSARKAVTPQSSTRLYHQAALQSYDYGDDRSDEFSYDDAAHERRSSRRPFPNSSAGGPRGKANQFEYGGRSLEGQPPVDREDLDDTRSRKLREDAHLGERAPKSFNGSWGGPSSPLTSGHREARDDEGRSAASRRDNRDGRGYSEDRRQQWQ
ncbi:hypothetical protein F4824DRAFT_328479 [Ustulina deusta]|nr:hypothetical protein F4824DRAFT_328479 [Ustulina deusta]